MKFDFCVIYSYFSGFALLLGASYLRYTLIKNEESKRFFRVFKIIDIRKINPEIKPFFLQLIGFIFLIAGTFCAIFFQDIKYRFTFWLMLVFLPTMVLVRIYKLLEKHFWQK